MSKDMKATHISSAQVRRAFSGATNTYDEHAVLQREVADRLLQHIEFAKIDPRRILDIGCGTGYFTRLITRRFKKADVTALDLSEGMVRCTSQARGRRMPWHGKRHQDRKSTRLNSSHSLLSRMPSSA